MYVPKYEKDFYLYIYIYFIFNCLRMEKKKKKKKDARTGGVLGGGGGGGGRGFAHVEAFFFSKLRNDDCY